jgi:hypothetical protein
MSEDQSHTICLTANGFAHLPSNCYENDFTFIIGAQAYDCPCVFADFLSPRLARLHSNDPTIREFVIDVSDPHDEFNSVLSIFRGSRLVVSDSTLEFFLGVARELLNFELFKSLSALHGPDPQNFVEELRFWSESGESFDYESLVAQCSASFFELPETSLNKLSVDLLESILSHPSLRILTENKLYEFVKSQILRDESYSVLLEFVRFEYLSLDLISDFEKLISSSFYLLTPSIWRSLLPCIGHSLSPSSPSSDRYHWPCCAFSEDRPLDGIISFLSQESGGNIHDRGIVEVSASGQVWSDCDVGVVVDFNSGLKGFATANAANSWICIDFKGRRIIPTHYSIRTRTDYDASSLRSWVIEGSNDCQEWILLDTRQDNQTMNGLGRVATFSVANSCFVRSIRIRQTGPNSNGDHYLVFKSLEFFGTICPGHKPA